MTEDRFHLLVRNERKSSIILNLVAEQGPKDRTMAQHWYLTFDRMPAGREGALSRLECHLRYHNEPGLPDKLRGYPGKRGRVGHLH